MTSIECHLKSIHGEDGNIDKDLRNGRRSCWQTIVNEARVLKNQGIDFFEFLKLKVGDGCTILFWKDRRCEAVSEVSSNITLAPQADRYNWLLNNDEVYPVASLRKKIDNQRSPSEASRTRWVKYIPIKVNILAWKIKLNALPTRFNLSRREWLGWLASLRHPIELKALLEGVFYITWWFLWGFRNKILFDSNSPSKAVLFDNIVSSSFTWCRSRCKATFTWNDWLKNPYLIVV
uniref:RNA-directed DNA polymerase, eukaryota n=1 Tax=Tanacetum cinerariifolium TaxID=118510 RepID=A0A699H4E5_TANCI|nr:RNA-directed DNA polymerase, eukaryota [Tanacetum cinerariifolium]